MIFSEVSNLQLFFFLLLAGDLVLTAAVLWQTRHCPYRPLPPPAPTPVQKPERPDPMDEGFENIMRFAVGTREGESL